MAQFLISIAALRRNASMLQTIKKRTGCRIVLAQKGFSCWKAYRYLRSHLDGCCASGLWEARLAHEHFGKEILTYSPAYTDREFPELLEISTHLDFNSLTQWYRFRDQALAHPRHRQGDIHFGLRINPEHSTGTTPLYDPCSPKSRLGITADELAGADLTGISGLHFHTLCEQGSDDLGSTLEAVDQRFGSLLKLPQITYFNMGGGHWITKPDYDRDLLEQLILKAQHDYQVEVWLEPGEACAIHSGVLRCQVLDVFKSKKIHHAILDISATAHMPDVLEMPYRPDVYLADPNGNLDEGPAVTLPGERYHRADTDSPHRYQLGGPTCLAGDVIGDYTFNRPLNTGDTLVFDDMAHYTMVKTTMFNGVPHPQIALQHEDDRIEIIREFDYTDFADRLS